MDPNLVWYVLGFGGQALFTSRFLVQWIASEKAGRSVIPLSFWFLSLGGSGALFVYAVHLGDPVFVIGQSLGAFVYLRNLFFVFREKGVFA